MKHSQDSPDILRRDNKTSGSGVDQNGCVGPPLTLACTVGSVT